APARGTCAPGPKSDASVTDAPLCRRTCLAAFPTSRPRTPVDQVIRVAAVTGTGRRTAEAVRLFGTRCSEARVVRPARSKARQLRGLMLLLPDPFGHLRRHRLVPYVPAVEAGRAVRQGAQIDRVPVDLHLGHLGPDEGPAVAQ